MVIEDKIKAILTKAYHSGNRAIDYQPCDVTDVWIQADLTAIQALIAEEQRPLVEALKEAKSALISHSLLTQQKRKLTDIEWAIVGKSDKAIGKIDKALEGVK